MDKLIVNDGLKQKDVDAGYTVEKVREEKDDYMGFMIEKDAPGFVERNNYWDRI